MMDGSLMVRSKCRPDIDHHPIFEVGPDEKSYYQSRDQPTRSYVPYEFYEKSKTPKALVVNQLNLESIPFQNLLESFT